MSETPLPFTTDYIAQCAAILEALGAAGIPGYAPDPETTRAPDVWVPLRPAMQVLRVPMAAQRHFERRLTTADETDGLHAQVYWDGTRRVVFLRVQQLFHVLHDGRHPVCIRFQVWFAEAMVAFTHHGHYDPAHDHTPPPGQELDALERREQLRDVWDTHFPGLLGLFWHPETSPEEGDDAD